MEALIEGILNGDRASLGKAFTLLESERPQDKQRAQDLLRLLGPHRKESMRIGITGPPGVGKSTFLDAMGTILVEQGISVAVLAVDPSSTVSGGSILGDKTRMERLSTHELSFIRPSPSSGTLGGVTRSLRSSIQLCEAAGYQVIFLETVGVGQSEVSVREYCDVLVLLTMLHSGDELQGIKRGVMEAVDLVMVNKSDRAEMAELNSYLESLRASLHLLGNRPNGSDVGVLSVSATTGIGIAEAWLAISSYLSDIKANGIFDAQRKEQQVLALGSILQDRIAQKAQELLASELKLYAAAIRENKITPEQAADEILKGIWK
jgi:LAO/AO transport system kinase